MNMATIFRRTLLRYVRLMSSQTWYTNHGRKYIQLLCRRLCTSGSHVHQNYQQRNIFYLCTMHCRYTFQFSG